MALPTPPHHSDPIPNDPFYSSRDYGLQGLSGYLVIGAGLSVTLDGVLSATNSWDGQLVAGDGISLSGTSEITISLTNTGVTAGSYSNATLSVDYQGRITSIVGGGVPVLRDDFTAKGTLLVGTGDDSYTALGSGPDGTVLTVDSRCATGLAWLPLGGGGGSPATPTVYGTVLGYTGTGACGNLSLGFCAGNSLTSSGSNIAIGWSAMGSATATCNTVAIGKNASRCAVGSSSVVIGHEAGNNTVCINNSVIVGAGAGVPDGVTCSYRCSVMIGPNVVGYDPGSGAVTRACELAIGFSSQDLWLSGDSTKAIRPGAGIIDCRGRCGVAGQVLGSTGGNALEWIDNGVATPATPTTFGTVKGQTCGATQNVSLDASGWALKNGGGCYNIALGTGALCSNVSGTDNIAMGYCSLVENKTGSRNVALSDASLMCLRCGGGNVAIGTSSLQLAEYTAGCCCAYDVSQNTAVGGRSMTFHRSGNYNSALGWSAGYQNCIGCFNTFLGSYAGCCTKIGDHNTLTGACAMACIVNGSCNVALGWMAGANLCQGDRNVVIGPEATLESFCSNCQLVIGFNSTSNWLTGDALKAIKPGAGIRDRSGCLGEAGQVLTSTGANAIEWADQQASAVATPTTFGLVKGQTNPTTCNISLDGTGTALSCNRFGLSNVAMGSETMLCNVSGSLNVAIGARSLFSSTGNLNTALGSGAGDCLTCGIRNVMIGPNVNVADPTGSRQLAIGSSDGCYWITGTCDSAIKPGAGIIDSKGCCGLAGQVLGSTGGNALEWINNGDSTPAQPDNFGTVKGQTCVCTENVSLDSSGLALSKVTTGFCNVAISKSLACNTEGCFNVGVGNTALYYNTTGSDNTAVGRSASFLNTTGVENTALGAAALRDNRDGAYNTALGAFSLCGCTGGSFNVAVGYCSGSQVTGNCNVLIGPFAKPALNAGCRQLAIGFSCSNYWLTGDETKAIKPGAGIIDCCNSCGTPGAVLRVGTDANTICWSTEGLTATCVIGGSTVVIKNGLIVSVT